MFISCISKFNYSPFALSSSQRFNFNIAKLLPGLSPFPKSSLFVTCSFLCSSQTTCVLDEKSPDSISLSNHFDSYKRYKEINEYPSHKSPVFDDYCLQTVSLVDKKSANSVSFGSNDNADELYERITEFPISKSPISVDSSFETTFEDDKKSPNLNSFVTENYTDKHCKEITEYPFPKSPVTLDSCIRSTCGIDKTSNSSRTNWDADKLYSIIIELANYPSLEGALDKVSVPLRTALVVEVLHMLRYEEKLSFRFFTWAATQEFYSHEPQVYNKMMDIVSSTKYKVKQFGIICDLLDYMKRNDKKKSVPVEVLLTILRKYTKKHLTHLRKFAKKKKISLKTHPEIDALNLVLDALCKCCLVEHAETM